MVTKRLLALSTVALVAVAACAPSADDDTTNANGNGDTAADETGGTADDADSTGGAGGAGEEASETVEVGIVYSETGPLASYGQQYREGLEAGIHHATDGTGVIDGKEISLTYRDDTGNPDTAVSIAKELIGQDVQILAGTVASGIALQMAEQAQQNEILYISGPAAVDAITGINEFTFRSGRQSLQDVAAAKAILDEQEGSNVVVFAQDNAFGQGNVAAVEAVLGAEGATVSSVLVPEDATEFTPFAAQLLESDADLIFVAWAGATAGSMWTSLEQQGVFDVAPVTTGLADSATFAAYGPVADRISFLSHYFPGAPDNGVNEALVSLVEDEGGTPDLFTPDGFVAGQMIAHAISEGEDVPGMIDALEGWTFDGPKGSYTIRESDHALVQDMYTAKLVDQDGTYVPELLNVVPGDEAAPPEAGGR